MSVRYRWTDCREDLLSLKKVLRDVIPYYYLKITNFFYLGKLGFWNTVISRDKSETLCDAGHRIAASPEDVQPGTVVLILRLNTVIPYPRRYSIHGDKERQLSCTSVTLQLEQLPDIILFRDCIAISFHFLPFSCFPRFLIMMPFSKVRHF